MNRSVRIKDHHAEAQLFEQRAVVAAVIMVIALGMVISRLVSMQAQRVRLSKQRPDGED